MIQIALGCCERRSGIQEVKLIVEQKEEEDLLVCRPGRVLDAALPEVRASCRLERASCREKRAPKFELSAQTLRRN